MIMKRLSVVFFVLVLSFTSHVLAQKNSSSSSDGGAAYKTGIGFRGGFEGGLTVKHFIQSDKAIEGILTRSWGYGGFRITGLYEIQKPIKDVPGLSIFYGFGAHVGFYNGRYYGYYGYSGSGYYDKNGKWHATGYRNNYTTLGIDGIVGVEYKIEDIPITVGLDVKPYFDIIGWSDRFVDVAISLRYTIK
jgi:hypothetical protein